MDKTRKIGLIAGTGFEPILPQVHRNRKWTPFGRFDYYMSELPDATVAVIPRHGFDHSIPAHRLPTKAQLVGLLELGIYRVLAASAVGSARDQYKVGEGVLPDQLLDLTTGRDDTFYHENVVHTDLSVPFCPDMRRILVRSAQSIPGLKLHDGGVYACYQAPRYRTPAEVEMIRRVGGDLLGQSAAQEAALARELGMCYALFTLVTNRAAGNQPRIDSRQILEATWEKEGLLVQLFRVALNEMAAADPRPPCTDNEFEASRLRARLGIRQTH